MLCSCTGAGTELWLYSASASLSPEPETLIGVGSVMGRVYGGSGHPAKLHGASWPARV